MTIWDRGSYEAEKWEARKIVVRFDGEQVSGRYSLFATRGKDWMIHRMDPPADDHEPMPERIEPMKATTATLPADDAGWAYEIKWDGVRAIAYCEPGRVRLQSRTMREITAQYPEIAAIALELAGRAAGARRRAGRLRRRGADRAFSACSGACTSPRTPRFGGEWAMSRSPS